jgi:hypothetical protein
MTAARAAIHRHASRRWQISKHSGLVKSLRDLGLSHPLFVVAILVVILVVVAANLTADFARWEIGSVNVRVSSLREYRLRESIFKARYGFGLVTFPNLTLTRFKIPPRCPLLQ